VSAVLLAYAVALFLASIAVLAWAWHLLDDARDAREAAASDWPTIVRLVPAWRPQDHPTAPKGLRLGKHCERDQ
jgi:hypothetical protein